MSAEVLATWHKMVAENDASSLDFILADEAIFYSPVVYKPQIGKGITKTYLSAAFQVLFNDTFEYVREIVGEREAVLEFTVEIDGIFVNGVDMITWNEDDQIVEFKVMIRPLKAINTLHERMIKALMESES